MMDAIKIVESDDGAWTLHVGTATNVASVRVAPGHLVKMTFNIAGPVSWPAAREFVAGLLELAVVADRLEAAEEALRGRSNSHRR